MNTDDPVNHPAHYTRHPSGVECIQITTVRRCPCCGADRPPCTVDDHIQPVCGPCCYSD